MTRDTLNFCLFVALVLLGIGAALWLWDTNGRAPHPLEPPNSISQGSGQ